MTIEIGILLAITSMLSWGISDFLSKKAIDRIGYVKSLLINQLVALGPIFVYAILFSNIPKMSTELTLLIIATSFLSIVGALFSLKD